MEVLTILAVGAMCIGCFIVGARVGQAVSKGEEIKLPNVNPMEAIRERRDKKEAELAQNMYETIIGNVDRYDGTGNGQKDVPKG